MSTKIYTAYRLKNGKNLWKFIHKSKQQAKEGIEKILMDTYRRWLDDQEFLEKIVKNYNPEDYTSLAFEMSDYLTRKYKEQVTSPLRTPFNMDVSYTVRESKGRYYIIPYCDGIMRNTLDFLREHEDLEEYSYWDNTDKPEEISQAKWNKRGDNWEKVIEHWDNYVTVEILNLDIMPQINPIFQLLDELKQKKAN